MTPERILPKRDIPHYEAALDFCIKEQKRLAAENRSLRARVEQAEKALAEVRDEIASYTECDCEPDDNAVCLIHRCEPLFAAARAVVSAAPEEQE